MPIPSKESRIESVFITVGAWKHLHWLTGLQFLRRSDHLTVDNIKVELNRIESTFSTCIELTLMMSRNDFNLCRIDLYRNDFVSKWPRDCNINPASECLTQCVKKLRTGSCVT